MPSLSTTDAYNKPLYRGVCGCGFAGPEAVSIDGAWQAWNHLTNCMRIAPKPVDRFPVYAAFALGAWMVAPLMGMVTSTMARREEEKRSEQLTESLASAEEAAAYWRRAAVELAMLHPGPKSDEVLTKHLGNQTEGNDR